VYVRHHASSVPTNELKAQPTKTISPADSNGMIDKFDASIFFKYKTNEWDGNKEWEDDNKIWYTYFIAEEKVHECPKMLVRIGGVEVLAILDTGCELTIMNQDLYKKIQREGNNYLELPTQHLTLVSAFNDKGKQVKKQMFVPITVGDVLIDQVVIISPQLITPAILGVDFLLIPVPLSTFLKNVPFLKQKMKGQNNHFTILKKQL
jgi:hypothetical protein